MVQRKAPHKIGSQAESKRSHVKLERQSSSHQQQDTRSKGGGDLKKKMKMVRSIKVADLESLQGSPMKPKRSSPNETSPNYMKPTSSSDARKERLQVTICSQSTTDKKRSSGNSKILNSPNPSSSSTSSGHKPLKSLSRQSSLKLVKPSMKKSSGVALHPKKTVIVNRATCSSTLKDSKFPKALDLNPGGSDAEGTSVMKVCPYTYCSLNGHRHAPLPPLKCFMSARRKLLKTQKSVKVKGLCSFRVKGLGKGEKEIDTGQKIISRTSSGLEINSLMEEVSNDFFVEIYTSKPQEQIIEPGNCDERRIQTEKDTEKPGECAKIEVKEDDQMNESYSDISFEDGLDQSSELSDEEIDVMMSFLEHVVCDEQVEEAEEENHPNLVPEDYAEGYFECCLVDESIKDRENKVSTFEATDLDWEEEVDCPAADNKTGCSECPDDGFVPISPHDELSIEPAINLNACDEYEADEELPQEANQEDAENGDAMGFDSGFLEGNDVDSDDGVEMSKVDDPFSGNNEETSDTSESLDQNQLADVLDLNPKPQEPELSEENGQGNILILEVDYTHGSNKVNNIDDSSFQCSEEEVSEEPEEGGKAGHALSKQDNYESCILEPDDPEAQQDIDNESFEEKENENDRVEDTSSLVIVQLSDSSNELTETDQGITEGDRIQTEPEIQVFKCDDASIIEDATVHPEVQNCPSDDQSDESSTENREKSEKEQNEEISKPTARISIIRRRKTEELEEMKEFNPRAPRFLLVEPDPEAEKIDLRHQMLDERKDAEEWMIDYALQRAVTKLAPARQRKVALLVEAFESVMPLPVCEKPQRHTTSGFAHARIIQACS